MLKEEKESFKLKESKVKKEEKDYTFSKLKFFLENVKNFLEPSFLLEFFLKEGITFNKFLRSQTLTPYLIHDQQKLPPLYKTSSQQN